MATEIPSDFPERLLGSPGRDAFEGKGVQTQPQKWFHRRLEEVAKAVGAVTVGYKCH